MRRCKRVVHKQFGGVGNFFAIIILVTITVIFVDSYVLNKYKPSHRSDDYQQHTIELVEYQNNTPDLTRTNQLRIPEECEITEKCSANTIPYKIRSGDGLEKPPVVCFDNQLLFHKNLKDSKIGRGVNMVAIDSKTLQVKLVQAFDTYAEENFFLRTLKVNLNNSDIILLASYDEMSSGLKEASTSLLEKYGSQLIKSVKYRDSFVMLGQKGLARGKAIEVHHKKGSRDFGAIAEISGCVKFPLGEITPLVFPPMAVNRGKTIAYGSSVQNCGLERACQDDEFAVHVYTGKDNNDEPKICVNGKYVISKGLNDAGRGINIVVVSNEKEILRTGHFDTWQDDSTNLEIFLENLEDNVIVIAVTFDEASQKLSQHSKNLFFDLGSATIQNLKYRDVWMLVGQKGITGFSPYEEISYAGTGNTYAVPVDKRMCVPKSLKGIQIRPDPIPYRNDKRREFCLRYEGYGDFCSELNVDRSLVAVPLVNKTLEDNPIYSTPILVIAGVSHHSLRMSLETLLMQPGINPVNVVVAVDEKFNESSALIELFGFRCEKILNSSNYIEHYEKALKTIWKIYPNKDKLIVIEEDLILSPDFLYTLALQSEIFRKDETIHGIQMWNPNSYDIVNGSNELIYRVNQFFGLGYLIRRSFYEKYIQKSFASCCSKRVWDLWIFDETTTFLMPDVSRVFRKPFDSNRVQDKHLQELFNRKRKTSLNPFPSLINLDKLRKDKYESYLIQTLKTSTMIKSLEKCRTLNTNLFQILDNQNSSNIYSYIYHQNSTDDTQLLLTILPCFGLYRYDVLGLYSGLLRFYSTKYTFYFVGSQSPFYSKD